MALDLNDFCEQKKCKSCLQIDTYMYMITDKSVFP